MVILLAELRCQVRLSSTTTSPFTTGTTGNTSTVKVKGAARFGLDEVALGVGTVPQIYNLVQATNADGVAFIRRRNMGML